MAFSYRGVLTIIQVLRHEAIAWSGRVVVEVNWGHGRDAIA
ncbi:hypothetical protein [Spirulina sp. 06S082]|nr:hypothetical protein [Spirulina sp. 06S082]MEA5469162.1 hypothetical protein [Spirulina sp. 06S082]